MNVNSFVNYILKSIRKTLASTWGCLKFFTSYLGGGGRRGKKNPGWFWIRFETCRVLTLYKVPSLSLESVLMVCLSCRRCWIWHSVLRTMLRSTTWISSPPPEQTWVKFHLSIHPLHFHLSHIHIHTPLCSFSLSHTSLFSLSLSVLLVDRWPERSPGEGDEQWFHAQWAGDPPLHGDQAPPPRPWECPHPRLCPTRPQTAQQLELLLWLQPSGAVRPGGGAGRGVAWRDLLLLHPRKPTEEKKQDGAKRQRGWGLGFGMRLDQTENPSVGWWLKEILLRNGRFLCLRHHEGVFYIISKPFFFFFHALS